MICSFDMEKLGALLKDFHNITNMRVTIFSSQYDEIISWPKEVAPICRYIRNDPTAKAACHACDISACNTAAKRRKTYVYQCHAGLTETVAPVYMGNIVVAYILFGHLFNYPSQQTGWDTLKTACSKYNLDETILQNYVKELPLIEKDYILSASHILQSVAYYLCMDRMITLRQQSLIINIDEYISEHFTEDINIPFLCEHFNIGKTSLCEISRQSYGCGIAEHIRKLRIDYAKKLLTDHQELNIGEIAEQSGFCDYNYFITVFKKLTGTSPGNFRKNQV